MSDTPRTDAKAPVTIYDSGGQEYTADLVPAQLCRQIERELNAAKAENEAMKSLIRQIYYDTETYADGAPDATAHDKLCNEISSQLEPYIK